MRKRFIRTTCQTSLMSPRNVPEPMVTTFFKRPSNSGEATINRKRVICQSWYGLEVSCEYHLQGDNFSWNWLTNEERRSLRAVFTGAFTTNHTQEHVFLSNRKSPAWRLNELWKYTKNTPDKCTSIASRLISHRNLSFQFISPHSAEIQNGLKSLKEFALHSLSYQWHNLYEVCVSKELPKLDLRCWTWPK